MNKKVVIFYLFTTLVILTSFLSINFVDLNFFFTSKSLFYFNHDEKRIFCIIYTTKDDLETKAKTVYETWAKKCDNHRFITLLPDQASLANRSYDLKYKNSFSILKPTDLVDDTYLKLTDKVYYSFKDVYKKFPDYDWYLKADDDTFVFMKNLQDFLKTKNHTLPVTYGYDFQIIVQNGYHSGGAGYVLSREAFNRLGKQLNENLEFCPNSGLEDIDVASCLRKLNVYMNNSLDEFGKERFHPCSMDQHYFGISLEWLGQYASNQVQKVLF